MATSVFFIATRAKAVGEDSFFQTQKSGVEKLIVENSNNLSQCNGVGKQQKEISYQEVVNAVDFASKATGVRKNFLMGMLAVESSLGKNVGGCTYGEVESGAESSYRRGALSLRAWNTFQKRREIIMSLAGKLGYDYHNLKVSCNPARYAGTGGAMGVAQFMPDTWLEYREEISTIVKKKNPDPWNIQDGVVAMAVKLADVSGVTEHNRLAERRAAKLYLSGSTSVAYEWYANEVLYWAENHKKIKG